MKLGQTIMLFLFFRQEQRATALAYILKQNEIRNIKAKLTAALPHEAVLKLNAELNGLRRHRSRIETELQKLGCTPRQIKMLKK